MVILIYDTQLFSYASMEIFEIFQTTGTELDLQHAHQYLSPVIVIDQQSSIPRCNI